MIRRSVKKLVALGFVGLLVLPSCGGDDTISAESYVGDLCTAVSDWLGNLQEQASDVQSSLTPGTSPTEGKEKLETFLNDAIDSTEQMIQEVEDAGVPDVDNGEEISSKIVELFGKAKDALEEAQSEVENLPTDDPTAFEEQTAQISETLRAQGESLSESLNEVEESEELKEAAEESDACQEIGGLE